MAAPVHLDAVCPWQKTEKQEFLETQQRGWPKPMDLHCPLARSFTLILRLQRLETAFRARADVCWPSPTAVISCVSPRSHFSFWGLYHLSNFYILHEGCKWPVLTQTQWQRRINSFEQHYLWNKTRDCHLKSSLRSSYLYTPGTKVRLDIWKLSDLNPWPLATYALPTS